MLQVHLLLTAVTWLCGVALARPSRCSQKPSDTVIMTPICRCENLASEQTRSLSKVTQSKTEPTPRMRRRRRRCEAGLPLPFSSEKGSILETSGDKALSLCAHRVKYLSSGEQSDTKSQKSRPSPKQRFPPRCQTEIGVSY